MFEDTLIGLVKPNSPEQETESRLIFRKALRTHAQTYCMGLGIQADGTHWDWPAPDNRRIFNGRFQG